MFPYSIVQDIKRHIEFTCHYRRTLALSRTVLVADIPHSHCQALAVTLRQQKQLTSSKTVTVITIIRMVIVIIN